MSVRLKKIIQLVIAAFAGSFAVSEVYNAYEGYIHRADFLYWDPAAHAFYGVKLAAAVESFDVIQILLSINEQVLWPPLHSIIQLPLMIGFGKTFLASSVCSLVFLGVFFVFLTICYQELSISFSGLAVLLCFPLTSPYVLAYSSMPMLEIFGASFTALSAALYLRRSYWFPLSVALLFFLKYNYCIYVLLPYTFLEYAPNILRVLKEKKLQVFRDLSSFQVFVAFYCFILVMILLTGGIKVGNLSLRGIGNPLYILYLLLLIRIIIKKSYIGLWKKLDETGWKWFVIPVGIWLLIPIPNRIRTLVSFSINAPLSGFSPYELSYYSFYLEKMDVYFASTIVLIACLVMAVLRLSFLWKDKRIVFLALLFVLPLLLMTINQNKQERYLFTFIFSLWILSALFVSRIPHIVIRTCCAVAFCTVAFFSYDPAETTNLVGWPFVPSCIEQPLEFVAKSASGAQNVTVLGATNDFSPALLMYHVQKENSFKNRIRFHWKANHMIPGSHLILIDRSANDRSYPPSGMNLKLIGSKNVDGCLQVRHYLVQ